MKKLCVMISTLAVCLGLGVLFVACGGADEQQPCNHAQTDATILISATCTETGIKRETCRNCGNVNEVTLAATGHSMQAATSSNRAATCTATGLTIEVCSNCRKVETVVADALGHKWNAGTESKSQNTCTTPDKTTYTCNNGCGATRVVVAEATGHDYTLVASASVSATCTDTGKETYKCSHCNDTYEIRTAANGHIWDNLVPTCTAGQTCTECGKKGSPALNHNYVAGNTTNDNCTANKTVTYTCNRKNCGVSYQTTVAGKSHNYTNIQWSEPEITQSNDGCVKTYSAECADCRTTVSRAETVDHTLTAKITAIATCQQTGTKTVECSVCGYTSTKAYTDTDAHKWNSGSEADSVTTYSCVNSGCVVTRKTISAKTADQTAVSSAVLKTAGEIELKNASIKIDKNETAIGNGNVSVGAGTLSDTDKNTLLNSMGANSQSIITGNVYDFTMSVDGNQITKFNSKVTVRIPYELAADETVNDFDTNSIVVVYIASNGTPAEVLATFEPAADGSNTGYAVFETDHFSYYTVTRMPASERCAIFGHLKQSSTRNATCLVSGYTFDICKRCGLIENMVTTAALGHTWNDVPGTAATCTAGGTTGKSCSVCDATYTITEPALGHDWEITETPATCVASGKNEYACKRTGCTEKHSESIAAFGHSYNTVTVAATCTSAGYRKYTCIACGNEYRNNFTPTAGHVWNIKAPTCTEGQICTVCQSIGASATGHDFDDNHICKVCRSGCEHYYVPAGKKLATCMAGGYDASVCALCGNEKRENAVAALGHNYGNSDVCSVCGSKKPQDSAFYANMLGALTADKFTVTLKDVRIYQTDGPGYMTATSDSVTLTLGYTADGKLYGYGEGKAKIETPVYYTLSSDEFKSVIEGNMVIAVDGGNAYISLTYTDKTSDFTPYENNMYMVVPVETLLNSVGMRNVMVTATMSKAVEKIMPIMRKLMQAKSAGLNTYMANVVGKLLTPELSGNEYIFTFDPEIITTLYADLGEKSVKEFTDGLFGAGFLNTVVAKINALLDSTIAQAIADFEKNGVSNNMLYDAINDIMNVAVGGEGEGFDIRKLLDSTEMFGDTALKNVKVGTIVASFIGGDVDGLKEQINSFAQMCEEQTILDLIPSPSAPSGPNPENPGYESGRSDNTGNDNNGSEGGPVAVPVKSFVEIIAETIEALKKNCSIKIIADSKGNVKTISVALKNTVVYSDSHVDYNGETVNTKLTIGGVIGIAPNSGNVDAKAGAIDKVKAIIPKLSQNTKIDGLNSGDTVSITVDKDGLIETVVTNITETTERYQGKETYRDSRIEYDAYHVTRRTGEITYDFSDYRIITLKSGICGNWGELSYSKTGEMRLENVTTTSWVEYRDVDTGEVVASGPSSSYTDMIGSYDFTLYYNSATKTFSVTMPHKMTKNAQKSKAPVGCEGVGWEASVCSECGYESRQYTAHGHGYEKGYNETLESLVGSTTCEDGVLLKQICLDCGKTMYTRKVYNHETARIRISLAEYGSKCGGYLILYKCLCGAKYFFSDDNELRCEMTLYNGNNRRNELGTNYYLSRCTVSDCGFMIGEVETLEKVKNTCTIKEKLTTYIGMTVAPKDGENALQAFTAGRFSYSNGLKLENTRSYIGDHTYRSVDETINPRTVTNDDRSKSTISGYRSYWICNVCGKKEGDEEIRTVISVNEKAIKSTSVMTHYYTDTERKVLVKETNYREYDIRTLKSGEDREVLVRWNVERYEDDVLINHIEMTYAYPNDLCHAVVTRNDDGRPESWIKDEVEHRLTVYNNRTCTQIGIGHCNECGENVRDSFYAGHYYRDDVDKNFYVCERCALESETDRDGKIILEDLTDHTYYGEQGYYVVGYALNYYLFGDSKDLAERFMSEQTLEISFEYKDENGEWVLGRYAQETNAIEVNDDGVSIIKIRIADVNSYCAQMGWSEYRLRVSFVSRVSELSYDIVLDVRQ